MWTRNILIAAAASVLAATPVLAQQKTVPASRAAATATRDTTQAKRAQHRSVKAHAVKADTAATKTVASARQSADSTAKHHAKKHVRHSTKHTAKKP